MAKYGTPPKWLEWPEMDFKHTFKKCNIKLAGPPPVVNLLHFFMKALLLGGACLEADY